MPLKMLAVGIRPGKTDVVALRPIISSPEPERRYEPLFTSLGGRISEEVDASPVPVPCREGVSVSSSCFFRSSASRFLALLDVMVLDGSVGSLKKEPPPEVSGPMPAIRPPAGWPGSKFAIISRPTAVM